MVEVAKPLIGVVVLGALAVGGWVFHEPIAASLRGIAAPAEPEKKPKPAAAPPNPDIVQGDSQIVSQLGLAFAKSVEREIVKPVDVAGVVAFDDRRVTHLKPRTSGRVLTLAVQPGDEVEAGQVLATLDASSVLDAQNGLESARAGLSEAKAARQAAQIAVKRAAELLKIGGIAKAELERRQVEVARTDAAVQSAQARTDMFQAQYQRLAPAKDAAPGTSEIVAPIKGVVVATNITLGEVIDTVKDAFTVADPSKVLVRASLFGFDINAVKRGDKARIEAPLGREHSLEARVLSVNAALDPLTNSAPARLEVDNEKGLLRANMFVSVRIDADFERRGVTIPAAAVQQMDDDEIAFVRTGATTFEKRTLKLGLQRPDWVEVKEGIAAGETVVTNGSFGLKALIVRNFLSAAE